MLKLSQTIVGNRYLIGDGGGYDKVTVTVVGIPTREEMNEHCIADEDIPFAVARWVIIDGKKEKEMFFENTKYPGYSLYVEPCE